MNDLNHLNIKVPCNTLSAYTQGPTFGPSRSSNSPYRDAKVVKKTAIIGMQQMNPK